MRSDAVLTVTEDGEPIISVKYTRAPALPLRCSAVLELTDFLEISEDPKMIAAVKKDDYLYTADCLFSLIEKYNASDKLGSFTYDRLRMLSKVYRGMRYEYFRSKRAEYLRLKQCSAMLSAAFRISSIIKKRSFENLTAGDCAVMKRYLISIMPDKCDMADYPEEMLEKLRPFFVLLRMLVEIAPAQGEKAMIEETVHYIYGDNF